MTGMPVDSASSIGKVLDGKRVGDRLSLVMLREGKPLRLSLTLAEEKR